MAWHKIFGPYDESSCRETELVKMLPCFPSFDFFISLKVARTTLTCEVILPKSNIPMIFFSKSLFSEFCKDGWRVWCNHSRYRFDRMYSVRRFVRPGQKSPPHGPVRFNPRWSLFRSFELSGYFSSEIMRTFPPVVQFQFVFASLSESKFEYRATL